MDVYLDNCCLNRPFDDQSQIRIRLETEAKLKIQEDILHGIHRLVWSYVIDYENSRNPFPERREQIARWRDHATKDVVENEHIITIANQLRQYGIKQLDALHVACAIYAQANYFLTTDDRLLNKAHYVQDVKITDPIGFIKEALK
ncbi:MAG: type II toxin-antitoxin system VapC family toxin [Chloroflexi bacterium]|nr:type II toxin-antitoxin system VapC family toxin [Chloroflexota bacterium]